VASVGGRPPLFALADFAVGQETERGRAAMYVARGMVFLAYQSPPMAQPEFEMALSIDPRNREARLGRGLVLAKLAQPDKAVAEANKALREGPPTADLYYSASRVFAQAVAAIPVRVNGTSRERAAQDRRAGYRRSALTLLAKAQALVPPAQSKEFWRKRVETDSAFQQFRNDPQFIRLAPLPPGLGPGKL
jgi:tetratricopeptide (TPR) repeat protein